MDKHTKKSGDARGDTWQKKAKEYELKKTRTKLALNICTICGEKNAKACQGCGTVAYCSTDCQRIDWRDRGHRKACKSIQAERAAEAARAEAPPSPPPVVFYGPAPRSHADEVRARIAAEHEAARARREANPEPEPTSARWGSRCPICLEEWDVNEGTHLQVCCCRRVCKSCVDKVYGKPCPLCRMPWPESNAEQLARLRRHVENEVPEAINFLGNAYRNGELGPKSEKKAVKLYKRAVELGDVSAMLNLGYAYDHGAGVKMNTKKGVQLYRMAANRGSAKAQCNIAKVLLEEQYDESQQEAFEYLKLSAAQGLTDAIYMVGCCYVNGLGTEVDLAEAKRWFERAAAKGHKESIRALETLARHST